MKKIIALILVLTLSVFAFAACGKKDKDEDNTPTPEAPAEATYTLSLAVETTVDASNKSSTYVAALVLDENNKVVAVRIDCVETTPALNADSTAVENVASVLSKVELGDDYKMTSGSFAKQTKAFEDALVGKTAEEVANLDLTLVAGCTMPYSPYSFKSVVAKAFASTNKNTFKTSESFTLGVAASMSIADNKNSTYFAATVVAGGKLLANVIDCMDFTYTVTDGVITTDGYTSTKVELGDDYKMTSGSFAKQTAAFEDAIVGKTAEEVTSLDLTLVAGCTMPYSPYSFKTIVVKAMANAR